MGKTALILGVIAGLFSIALWFVLVFYNPYTTSTFDSVAVSTFFMLLLPACLAIISSLMNKKHLMLIAFIWSLPFSLYLALTPGIFSWFIASCIAYFISFFLMLFRSVKDKDNKLNFRTPILEIKP